MSMQYAIWGKPPGADEERLLVAKPHGQWLTNKARAERIRDELEREHGCTALRIQEIDMNGADIAGMFRDAAKA